MENVKPSEAYIDPDYATPATSIAEGYGGYAHHPSYSTKFLIPGLLIKTNLDATPSFFSKMEYSLVSSTPSNAEISWQPSLVPYSNSYTYNGEVKLNYPFEIGDWVYYEKTHATPIEFLLSERGIVRSESDLAIDSVLSDVIRYLRNK